MSDDNFFTVEAWKNFIATDIIRAIEETNLYDARVNYETWVEAAIKLNVPPIVYSDFIYILVTRQTLLKQLEQILEKKDPVNYRDAIIDWLDNLSIPNFH